MLKRILALVICISIALCLSGCDFFAADTAELDIQKRVLEATGKNVEVMVYGDGAFKDPKGKIWELADLVLIYMVNYICPKMHRQDFLNCTKIVLVLLYGLKLSKKEHVLLNAKRE